MGMRMRTDHKHIRLLLYLLFVQPVEIPREIRRFPLLPPGLSFSIVRGIMLAFYCSTDDASESTPPDETPKDYRLIVLGFMGLMWIGFIAGFAVALILGAIL